jgi:predicted GNAT family N-acyltransferase
MVFSEDEYTRVEVIAQSHNLAGFDCGDEDINDFLRHDALVWQENKLAVTRLFIQNDRIIGFYCASADSIKLDDGEKLDQHLGPKKIREFPAVKIGRLGRSVDCRQSGVGDLILKWAIGHARKISDEIGVKFVTVDAYPHRIAWYEHRGFVRNQHKTYENRGNTSLRLLV